MAAYGTSSRAATTPAATNLTTSAKTVISLTAATATLRRSYVYNFEIGADGVPNVTDCAITWDAIRITDPNAANSVAMTKTALEISDAASGSVVQANNTAEPTVTANAILWGFAMNQRASYRWVVNYGGPGELIVPATNLAGIAWRALSSNYASTVIASLTFRE